MNVQNVVEYIIFIIFQKVIALLGFSNTRFFGNLIAFIFYSLLKIRRNVVTKNLQLAFPDFSNRDIHNLAEKNYKSFGKLLAEIFCIPSLSKNELFEIVDNSNLAELNEQNRFANGAILLTAHFGNWEIGAVSAGSQLDIPLTVLAKAQRNEFVSRWIDNMRQKHGNKVIHLGPSVREIYKAVKEKKIVGVVGDQRGPIDGDKVKFFNRDTSVFSGTAEIALKANVPIFANFVVRMEENKFINYVEEIKYQNFTGSKEEKVHMINQTYMSILEKYIRKFPEQWFWMHNIWKY
jgi:KDO2-lipid IV(A) lauroyltransferase